MLILTSIEKTKPCVHKLVDISSDEIEVMIGIVVAKVTSLHNCSRVELYEKMDDYRLNNIDMYSNWLSSSIVKFESEIYACTYRSRNAIALNFFPPFGFRVADAREVYGTWNEADESISALNVGHVQRVSGLVQVCEMFFSLKRHFRLGRMPLLNQFDTCTSAPKYSSILMSNVRCRTRIQNAEKLGGKCYFVPGYFPVSFSRFLVIFSLDVSPFQICYWED